MMKRLAGSHESQKETDTTETRGSWNEDMKRSRVSTILRHLIPNVFKVQDSLTSVKTRSDDHHQNSNKQFSSSNLRPNQQVSHELKPNGHSSDFTNNDHGSSDLKGHRSSSFQNLNPSQTLHDESDENIILPVKALFHAMKNTQNRQSSESFSKSFQSSYQMMSHSNAEDLNRKQNKWKIGFPDTDVKATLFSRENERVYTSTKPLVPRSELVEQPKGDPPDISKVFGSKKGQGGHVCIVGPTGSGKSTIVRGILCQMSAEKALAIYSLEYPVEVNLQTHGLFNVCQIDMFQEIQGKQRSLAETANNLLKHDPDIIYFGELRHKVDFETATSIALSGVQVISTGHASSPIDLLERLRSMNIDLKTQFRAFKCILGVKRVPILCPHCKQRMVIYGKTDNRALKLLTMYRVVTTEKVNRRKEVPVVCMPPEPSKNKADTCPHCVNGYISNHTIYEFLYITPESDMETLRKKHTYTTEETLLSLIMQGEVNPLYLQNSIH
ncbi:hypothetical protein C9374_001099 [Naegleria lovaniensis]|uniref:AAA+ ATPase domain-containing protein n=1 Tax=Naegleria lovaniensis TaxID=51637 RepID=A0AA88KL59_NAELO|nr:uncharacterized protein C9374_001099 [Naegleria lovaniensis]KAG2387505.1 hypothetical protein C9374_001099 [Naegleria lovaniensis]